MSFAELLNNVPLTWISVAMFGIYVIYRLGMVYLKKQKNKNEKYKTFDELAMMMDRKINGKIDYIQKEVKEIKKIINEMQRKK